MPKPKNVLWIMCDQLRYDYLGCTGHYMRSHGSHWNGWPLRVGEPTLGDHLNRIGVRNVLVGKTHMAPDIEGLKALGISPDSIIGVHVAECGFEPYERD